MSATLDANLLLYASDDASPFHAPARDFLQKLARGPALFYVFWPVLMSYLRIATHTSIFERPLTPSAAAANVDALLGLPNARTGSETERFWEVWQATTRLVPPRGNVVPDAHLVALMHEYGVGTIYSRDRGLRRFEGIEVLDPFEEVPS